MNLHAVGDALFFFGLLIAEVMVSLAFFVYLSHCVHLVLTITATGGDEVTWSSEPFIDWVGQAVHLLYMASLAAVLGVLVFLPLHVSFLPKEAGLRAAIGSAGSFWLLFPLFAVSSCTAPSPWMLLYPRIIAAVLRRPGTLLVVYLAWGVMLGLCGAAFYLLLVKEMFLFLPVACVAGSTAVLLYTRLLGRWTWIVSQGTLTRTQSPATLPIVGADGPKKTKKLRRKKRRSATGVEVSDPWDVQEPEEEAPEAPAVVKELSTASALPAWMDIDLVAYNLSTQETVEQQDTADPVLTDDALQLTVDRNETAEQEKKVPRIELPPLSEYEMKLADRGRKEPLPNFPLVSGIYTFPWYPTTINAWFRLTAGLFAVTGLLVLLIRSIPGHGE